MTSIFYLIAIISFFALNSCQAFIVLFYDENQFYNNLSFHFIWSIYFSILNQIIKNSAKKKILLSKFKIDYNNLKQLCHFMWISGNSYPFKFIYFLVKVKKYSKNIHFWYMLCNQWAMFLNQWCHFLSFPVSI